MITLDGTQQRIQQVCVLLVYGGGAAWERLAGGLAREGLLPLTVSSGDEALRRFRTAGPDVVVLDSEAAPFDSFALCRAFRGHSGDGGAAILVLGHRLDDTHVVAAYTAGADAYVPLPCAPQVLAARVRALAGKAGGRVSFRVSSEPLLRVGDWVLDVAAQEVCYMGDQDVSGHAGHAGHTGYRGTVLALTRAESRLLHQLVANTGRTISLTRLGEYAAVAQPRFCISRLRRKLGLPPTGPGAIEAQEGVGYRYVPPERTRIAASPAALR